MVNTDICDENDLVAGTATSLPIYKYTPQFTLVAINDPTTFTTPIVNIPLCLQIYKHL